jgi:hypothetical protein
MTTGRINQVAPFRFGILQRPSPRRWADPVEPRRASSTGPSRHEPLCSKSISRLSVSPTSPCNWTKRAHNKVASSRACRVQFGTTAWCGHWAAQVFNRPEPIAHCTTQIPRVRNCKTNSLAPVFHQISNAKPHCD